MAQAHALTQLDVKSSFAILGVSGDGKLPDSGTARLQLNVSVWNPSSRSLTFDTVVYKAYLQDLPREASVNTSRTDVRVSNGTASGWFYLAFSGSDTSSQVAVPAQGMGTVAIVLDLSTASYPDRFRGVQNITNFAVSRGQSPAAIPWSIFVLTSLDIDGVPPPGSLMAPVYQFNIPRIVLEFGVDYGG
ncbi:MAG TPA: hypothetical protein VFA17_08170 [Thermoplasmata archaeon]|nr:hypothetical protein [Thermoplasmata archaeon]